MLQALRPCCLSAGYFARQKDCVPEIEAGEPCLEDDVCIDDAQCSGSPRGACTCNEGFYQDGRTCRKKVSHTWRERGGVLVVEVVVVMRMRVVVKVVVVVVVFRDGGGGGVHVHEDEGGGSGGGV